MLIDLHFHTKDFSACSRIHLDEGIARAKEIGLDGICLTEHDTFASYRTIPELSRRYGLTILVGTEIFTRDGDILCFGLSRIPDNGFDARELTETLARSGGATIAAHPYRDNNRGVGDLLFRLPRLTAIEAVNGNTADEDNSRALLAALELGLPVTGSSDAHSLDRIGMFATRFHTRIETIADLSAALRSGDYEPVRLAAQAGGYANA